jgi:predicted amidohydrolase YtcJ
MEQGAVLFINGAYAYRNGTGKTGTGNQAGIYVSDGIIRAVGDCRELQLQLSGRDYKTVDLQGQYVLPGLADSHMHLAALGEKLSKLDFSETACKDGMLRLIRSQAEVLPEGAWITGMNWDENRMEGGAPGWEELNEAAGGHPLFLTRTCYHAFLVNGAAYERAGISAGAPDPSAGSFGRRADGGWDGWVYEEASEPFYRVQPVPSYRELKERVRLAASHALSLGLTAVHSEDWRALGSVDSLLRIFRELREEGVLLRTHQLLFHQSSEELREAGLTFRSGDDWFRLGAMKLFADGALGGRTALLSRPYADDPGNCGMAMQSLEELSSMVRRLRLLGMPIAVHAIGDAGAELAIAAMEEHPARSGRDRLIHAQLLTADLAARMRRLPLAVDIQPRFVASDFPWAEERVGQDRLEWFYAWRKLLGSGLRCAGGSDAPIEPLDPFLGLHAAVTRRKPGQTGSGYLPEERLTLGQALRLFTEGSAWAACEESERGRLAPGWKADLTVIDRPVTDENPEDLLRVRPLMTVVNGEIAFQALR